MSELRFEWDPGKARANRDKHGVSFEEAKTVFWDEQALFFEDPVPEEWEERFILLGLSSSLRTLVVVHALRDEDSIRIISARRATKREVRAYKERLR